MISKERLNKDREATYSLLQMVYGERKAANRLHEKVASESRRQSEGLRGMPVGSDYSHHWITEMCLSAG